MMMSLLIMPVDFSKVGSVLSWAWARCCLFSIVLLLSACAARVEMLSGLDELEANEIIGMLASNGIDAQKLAKKEIFTITVPKNDLTKSLQLLKDHGLPRKKLATLGEIFKKEGMVSTPLEERARYIYGLSQELERTLSQINGVVLARVHVVLPERVNFGEPFNPSSAAVFLKHSPHVDLSLEVPNVKRLVGHSIPGLSEQGTDKISVVLSVVSND